MRRLILVMAIVLICVGLLLLIGEGNLGMHNDLILLEHKFIGRSDTPRQIGELFDYLQEKKQAPLLAGLLLVAVGLCGLVSVVVVGAIRHARAKAQPTLQPDGPASGGSAG